VAAGSKLPIASLEGRSTALDAKHGVLAVEDEIADLSAKLSEMTGTAIDGHVRLVVPPRAEAPDSSALVALAGDAMTSNPDIEAAGQTMRKADRGLAAARATYIPDITVFGQEVYQTAVAMLPKNNFSYGIKAQWTVFDFGKREADIGERAASRRTAEENLLRVKRHISAELEQAQRKVQRSARNAALAGEVLALRREARRITGDQAESGLILTTARRESDAAVATAEADWIAAEVGQRLAVAELRRLVGKGLR
jgi:outer membrane protein